MAEKWAFKRRCIFSRPTELICYLLVLDSFPGSSCNRNIASNASEMHESKQTIVRSFSFTQMCYVKHNCNVCIGNRCFVAHNPLVWFSPHFSSMFTFNIIINLAICFCTSFGRFLWPMFFGVSMEKKNSKYFYSNKKRRIPFEGKLEPPTNCIRTDEIQTFFVQLI